MVLPFNVLDWCLEDTDWSVRDVFDWYILFVRSFLPGRACREPFSILFNISSDVKAPSLQNIIWSWLVRIGRPKCKENTGVFFSPLFLYIMLFIVLFTYSMNVSFSILLFCNALLRKCTSVTSYTMHKDHSIFFCVGLVL